MGGFMTMNNALILIAILALSTIYLGIYFLSRPSHIPAKAYRYTEVKSVRTRIHSGKND